MGKERLTLEETIKEAAFTGDLLRLERIITGKLAKFQGRGDTLTPAEQVMQKNYLRTRDAIVQHYIGKSKLTPPGAEASPMFLEK
jgi:hypothetical protein